MSGHFMQRRVQELLQILRFAATIFLASALLTLLLLGIFVHIAEASTFALVIDGKDCGNARSSTAVPTRLSIETTTGLTCAGAPPQEPPGTPQPPTEPPVPGAIVVEPGYGLTFLPNCVNGVHWATTNCEFTGSIGRDQRWAIMVDNSAGSQTSFNYVTVSRSETGDSSMHYQVAVSTRAGDFDVSPHCINNSTVTTAWEGAGVGNACPVPLGKLYVNVRVNPSTPNGHLCGSQLTCRPKVFGTLMY